MNARTLSRLLCSASALFMLPAAALAQQDDGEDGAQTPTPQRPIEQIVVTGRPAIGTQVTQFQSSSSITTFGDDALEEIGPLTLSDVFAEVPGVWAETSGGQAAANVFVRGIPAPGQFLFTHINVDGMPVFEEHGIGFLTPDGLLRVDETIRRVEAVRGGSASVFASNSPGGIFNHITRKGTPNFEGVIKGEWGNFNHYRVDGLYSGPISDETTFMVGGFYRIDDGVRDPGFTGNEGGHIRASVTHQLDDGEFTVYGDYIDEENIFYLPIPLALDGDGELTSIDGLDANFGTLVSDDIRLATFVQPGGNTQTFDLSDGINNEAVSVGGEFNYDIGDWKLVNKTRYIDATTNFISAIAFSVAEAQSFLDGQLEAAQDEFGADRLALRFARDGIGTETTFDFVGPGGAGGNNGNGLLGVSGFFGVVSDFDNFQNDLQFGRVVEAFGSHSLTLGFYASIYSIAQTQQVATYLHEVDNSPENLEIFAVDDSGDVVGAVTQNSFLQYGNGYENYAGDGEVFAIYAADEWQITRQLRLDINFRYERQDLEGAVETVDVFNESGNNPLIPQTGLPTLADDEINFGTGNFIAFSEGYDEFAYSIGTNYELFNWLAFYARASDGFRTPTLDDLAVATLGAGDSGDLRVNDIFQVEGGFKIDLPYLQAFITGFFSDFADQTFTEPVLDEAGNQVNVTILQSADTVGLEAEAEVGPFFGFSLNAKATFQQAEISSFDLASTGAGFGIEDTSFAGLSGNDVPRVPGRIIIIRPTYSFDFDDYFGSVFIDIFNTDDRFQDFGNTVVLPGYTTLGAGAVLNIEGGLTLKVTADNLTNKIGLTEGNPRTDLLAGPAAGSQIATFGRPIVGRNVRVSVGYRF